MKYTLHENRTPGTQAASSRRSSSIHSMGWSLKGTPLYIVQNLQLLWVQPWVTCSSGKVGH